MINAVNFGVVLGFGGSNLGFVLVGNFPTACLKFLAERVETGLSVGDNLKAVFPSEEDFRYHKIRQNKWD